MLSIKKELQQSIEEIITSLTPTEKETISNLINKIAEHCKTKITKTMAQETYYDIDGQHPKIVNITAMTLRQEADLKIETHFFFKNSRLIISWKHWQF